MHANIKPHRHLQEDYMPASHSLDDAYTRISRAKAKNDELADAIQRWNADNPNALEFAHRIQNGLASVLVRARTMPPRDWALALGDILQDLRFSLDYGVAVLSQRS
jgi:hypothetical protein